MQRFERPKPETRYEAKGQGDDGLNWENIDVIDITSNAVIRMIQVRRGSIFPDRPKLADVNENH